MISKMIFSNFYADFFPLIYDPNLGYLLMIIGLAFIFFELQSPGGFIFGTLGFGCFISALIIFHQYPLDYLSFFILLLGFLLLILEYFIISYGLLTIMGLLAFYYGSFNLFKPTTNGLTQINSHLIISVVIALLFYIALIAYFLKKTSLKRTGNFFFFGEKNNQCEVLTILSDLKDEKNFYYQVKFHGQIWKAKSIEDMTINEIALVEGTNLNQLLLTIKKRKT